MRNMAELDTPILLKKRTARKVDGSMTDAWEPFAALRAAVYYGSDREFAAGGQVNAERNAVFTIRRPWRTELDSGIRLEMNGEDWEVLSVQPYERRWLKLKARRRSSEGLGGGE